MWHAEKDALQMNAIRFIGPVHSIPLGNPSENVCQNATIALPVHSLDPSIPLLSLPEISQWSKRVENRGNSNLQDLSGRILPKIAR
jgi:hypothetical protein